MSLKAIKKIKLCQCLFPLQSFAVVKKCVWLVNKLLFFTFTEDKVNVCPCKTHNSVSRDLQFVALLLIKCSERLLVNCYAVAWMFWMVAC